jgi:hypothetical protein
MDVSTWIVFATNLFVGYVLINIKMENGNVELIMIIVEKFNKYNNN